MHYGWKITIDDYLAVVKRAEAQGIQPGDSIEQVFLEYMKEKGQKHDFVTELNKEEMINQMTKKQNILHVDIDKTGKTNYKFIKKDDNSE